MEGTFQSSVSLQSILGRGTVVLRVSPKFASTSDISLDVDAESQGPAPYSSVRSSCATPQRALLYMNKFHCPVREALSNIAVAVAGSSNMSDTCPEVLLQKALMLAFSEMTMPKHAPRSNVMNFVDKVNRYVNVSTQCVAATKVLQFPQHVDHLLLQLAALSSHLADSTCPMVVLLLFAGLV